MQGADHQDTTAYDAVFIAGWGRSGSTLLERMLAEVDDVTTVGELFQLWGDLSKRTCCCGESVTTCPWWAEVLTSAFGVDWQPAVERVGALRRRAIRHRFLPGLLGLRPLPSEVAAGVARYREAIHAVHRAAAEVDGAAVVVDASKSPIDLLVLAPSAVRLHAVHLTRDARGVAASWKRERPRLGHDGGVGRMMQHSAARSAGEWTLRNALVDATVRRYDVDALLVGYHEMVEHPEATLRRVLARVGRRHADLDFVQGSKVELGARHALGGNPGRARVGTIELRADEGWRRELTRPEQLAVRALAAPLAWRYPP